MIRGISDRSTFRALRSEGEQVRAKDLRVRWLPATNPAEAATQVAYAIPRKVGGAVVRNRIRRRIRGVLDQHQLHAGAMLFIIHPSCAERTFPELKEQVEEVLKKIEKSKVSVS